MRALIQRVKSASVTVNNDVCGKIDKGLLIFLGIANGDQEADGDWLVNKCLNLRIFNNEQGQFDLSLSEIKGEILVVSQFTLYANCQKGRRPSFTDSAPPPISEPLYNYVVNEFKKSGLKVASGIFGADMLVDIKNDGPVTIMLEQDRQKKSD